MNQIVQPSHSEPSYLGDRGLALKMPSARADCGVLGAVVERRGGLPAGPFCQDGGGVSADGRRMLLFAASAGRWGQWLSRRSASYYSHCFTLRA